MKNLYPRRLPATLDASVTQRTGISQNCSFPENVPKKGGSTSTYSSDIIAHRKISFLFYLFNPITMKRQFFSTFLLSLIAVFMMISEVKAGPLAPITYYVDAGRPDNSGNGLTWATAKKDIQAAINLATATDQVWVKAGTYYPTDIPAGLTATGTNTPVSNRDKTIFLKDGVKIYGGFAGTEASLAERVLGSNRTIVDGDIGTAGDSTDNCYHLMVYLGSYTTTGVTIDGFTIRNGTGATYGASVPPYDASTLTIGGIPYGITRVYGGGIYLQQGLNNIINNVIFDKNYAKNRGFGLWTDGGFGLTCSYTVTNCYFINNYGIQSTYGSWATNQGKNYGYNLVFYNNKMLNFGLGDGVALFLFSGENKFVNCSFVSNKPISGAVVNIANSAKSYFTNCLFFNNKQSTIYNPTRPGAPDFHDVQFLGSFGKFTNCSLSDSASYYATANHTLAPGSTGNLFLQNPAFADINSLLGADGKYFTSDDGLALPTSSPCKNAGINDSLPPALTKDITGANRILGTTVDIGAYEIDAAPLCSTPAPTASNQTFCNSATVANLLATGSNIKWYAAATGGLPLAASTPLTNGTKYYASQTVGSCESSVRAVDSVTISATVAAKADSIYCNGSRIAVNFVGASTNTYSWTATQNGTGIAASGTGNTSFTGANNTNAVLTDTIIVSAGFNSPYSYSITDGTYTFADTTGSTYLNLSAEYSTGNLSTVKPVGFDFNFFGTNFSSIYISKLGSVSFDAAGTKLVYGQQRNGWTTDASSKIAYKTTGTAPNRKLIVSFIDLKKPADVSTGGGPFFPPTSTTYTADPVAGRGHFQIVLSETDNTIESLKQSVPSLTAFSIPIGMGPSGPVYGNYEGVKDGSNEFYVAGRQNGIWSKLTNESKIFTPIAGFTCTPQKDTFAISVLPTPKVDSIANVQVCPGSTVAAINFTTPIIPIGIGSTVGYKWTNSNTAIGLAASGFGNIPSFTAPATAQTSTISVRPYMLKTSGDTCFGTIRTFVINADLPPAPTTVDSIVVYTGTKTISQLDVTPLTGGTLNYFYQATGGTALAASAMVVDDTTYYVSQTVAGCESNLRKAIKVNRIAADSIVLCSPDSVASLTATPLTGNTAKWYDAASGGTALNSSAALFVGQDTLYVNEENSVSGAGKTNRVPVIIIANPTATVTATTDKVVCNNSTVAAVNFSTTNTVGATTYAWTNNKTSIGLTASGIGNIASFTAVNNGTAPDTATIIVTPTITNGGTSCAGIKDTFLIIVNPTAVVNAVNNQVVCAGATNNSVSFSSNVAGTTYTWTNSSPSIGLAASGSGPVPSFVAVNNSPNEITATITVTPTSAAGCAGQPITYTITVSSLSVAPVSINNPKPIVCANDAFATLSLNGGALGSGAEWKWYADSLNTVSIGSSATLSNIPVAKTTTYFVRAEGTCNNTAAASVVVQRANLVSHVRQHWSDVLLFDNSSKNFVAWQWYKNGVAVNGATLQQYSESSALVGTYYVIATDKNGVKTITCPLTITAGSFTGLQISLFPNPVDIGSNVKISTSFTANELEGASIIITDLYGQVLRQLTQVTPVTSIQAPAATGMYIVTLTLQNGKKYSANLLTK